MRWLIGLFLVTYAVLGMAVDRFTLEHYFRDTHVRVIDDEKGTTLMLPTDPLFASGDRLKFQTAQYPVLRKVLQVISQYPEHCLSITAHTDNIATQAYQDVFSYQQAKQVADYLVLGGVHPSRIRQVSGQGDRWPIAANDHAMGRAVNRRIEITFLRVLPAQADSGAKQ